MPIRASVGSVGISFPFSSWEIMDADRPVCLPKSASAIFFRSRKYFNLRPISYVVSVRRMVSSLVSVRASSAMEKTHFTRDQIRAKLFLHTEMTFSELWYPEALKVSVEPGAEYGEQ